LKKKRDLSVIFPTFPGYQENGKITISRILENRELEISNISRILEKRRLQFPIFPG